MPYLREVYQVPPGEKPHKNWQCPKCGRKFSNPVPAFGVTCGVNRVHDRPVEMKPVLDTVATSLPR